MRSISDIVNEIVKNQPLFEECLSKKIVNFSGLARILKPEIERQLYKSVKEGAIVMALKRLEKKLEKEKEGRKKFLKILDLTLKSNLVILTYANSPTLLEKARIFQIELKEKEEVFILSNGIRETSFTTSSEITAKVKKYFKNEKLIFEKTNLSAITIRLPKEMVFIPGSYYQILKILAWENINLIDIFSTTSELTLIVEDKDVSRAFSNLKNLKIQK